MDKPKWVTMKDVADRANVGKITVSRVIRTPEKVSQETRRRVEDVIRELGYVPDETAGALSSNRSRVIGALVSTLSDSVFASTIEGLSRTLRQSGYELLLSKTDYEPELETAAIRTLLGRRPDGLVLSSTDHTDSALKLLASSGVPVVEIWQLPDHPIDHVVGFSNYHAGRTVTDYLIQSSRQRIAFIGTSRAGDRRGKRRAEGYRDALINSGLGEALYIDGDLSFSSDADIGASGFAQALTRWPDLDAVVCVSDPVAMGAICEASRRGIQIPGQMAITGFGGLELARESALNLTTIEFPGQKIGEVAAEILIDPEQNERKNIVDLGFNLVRRGTA